MSLSELHRLNQRLKKDKDFLLNFIEVASKEGDYAAIEFVRKNGFDITLDEYALLDKGDYQDGRLSVGKMDRFFIMLSGASPKILASCPESEQKRQATLGGAVLIPTVFAAIASSIMLETLNVNLFFIVIYALFWMTIVLLMDRALLATYSHSSSGLGKYGQIALRLVIAFLMAVTISHPVALKLFNESISTDFKRDLLKSKEFSVFQEKCDKKNPDSPISKSLTEMESAHNKVVLPSGSKGTEENECNKVESSIKESDDPELQGLKERESRNIQRKNEWTEEARRLRRLAQAERDGTITPDTSGNVGCSRDCREYLRQANEFTVRISALERDIAETQNRILNRQNQIQALASGERLAEINSCRNNAQQIKDLKIQASRDLIKDNEKEYSRLIGEYEKQSNSCTAMEQELNNRKPDVITQIGILHKNIFQDDGVAWDKLFIFLSFAFLFMAIDMLAIALKMASAGIYEVKADMMEYANVIRSFSKMRHEAIFQFSKLSEQEQEYLDDLQEGGSKEGLRVNLNTMIDAFNKADAKKLAGFFKRYLSGK